MILSSDNDYFLSIKQLIFVVVQCGVLSEVRSEFINVTQTASALKG
jgi:hypothetical protein